MDSFELKEYRQLLREIKAQVRSSQPKAIQSVNATMIQMYWQIGCLIDKRQKEEGWGAAIIPRLAADLKSDLPDQNGFSVRNLKYMISFYWEYPLVQPPVAQLIDNVPNDINCIDNQDFQKEKDYRDKVYENIPFKTSEELKRKSIKEQKIQVLAIRTFLLLLTIIIPLAWLIGGLLYSAIAFLSTLWAFSILMHKALKFWGIIKESKSSQEKNEKERRMVHHDYHCCQNPEGFERLRNENWERERRQKIKNEHQKLVDNNGISKS